MSRVRIRNLALDVNEQSLKGFFSPAGEITDVRVMRTDDGESKGFAFIGFRTKEAGQEAIRRFNGIQFKGYRIICEIASDMRSVSSSQAGRHGRAETCRLFVRNFPYVTSEQELKEAFIKFGEVVEVRIMMNKKTGNSRGIAFIQYTLPDSASRAIQELNYSNFQGRIMHVKEAPPMPAYRNRGRAAANRAPSKRQRR